MLTPEGELLPHCIFRFSTRPKPTCPGRFGAPRGSPHEIGQHTEAVRIEPDYEGDATGAMRAAAELRADYLAIDYLDAKPYAELRRWQRRAIMELNVYTSQLLQLRDSVPEDKRAQFDESFTCNSKKPAGIFGLSYWLGWLGIDRFMLGQPLLGVLKLITLGGLGIWYLVDWFLVGGVARDRNIAIARELRDTLAR